ncbi:Oidioi.mRNA.OKI2018_I69.chr1.g3469.t1.cds [Oikopleura dioica]|uniref:Oidioi.mRNA.OKI2018_I69.chr1.g3469.t1.cds n=1 Tax=Oikopleura dioica TaxID=34765 RepID=A0ABN7SZM3_OIKDI|nr:Oidioi.mRNA.OKI2018_I69.chr1.g3469.t1.cds [Oikopleura dioica]
MAKSKKSKAAILDEAPAENTVKIEVAENLESTKNTDLTPKKKSKRAKKKEVKAVIDDIDNDIDESFDMVEAEEEDFVVTGGDGETVVEGLEVAPKIEVIPLATDVESPEDYEDNAFDEKVKKEIKNEADEDASENAPPSEVKTDVRSSEDRTIFVKNLPFDTTVEELEALFIHAKEVRLLTKASGKCRGKAFVEMKTVEAAQKAHDYKKWDLRKKRLEVDLCGAKSSNTNIDEIKETGTLSIKANTEFDEMDLEDLFEDPVQIRFPKNGLNIAYAQFESKEVAKKYKESDLEINGQTIVFNYVPDRVSAPSKSRKKGEKWEKKKQAKAEAAIKANKEKRDKFKDRMTKRKNEDGTNDDAEEASPKKVFKQDSSRGSFRGRGGERGSGRGRGSFRGGSSDRGSSRGRGGDRDGRGRGSFRGGSSDRGGGRGSSRGGSFRGGSRGGADRGRGGGRGRGGSDRGRGGSDRGGRGSSRGFSKPRGSFKRD